MRRVLGDQEEEKQRKEMTRSDEWISSPKGTGMESFPLRNRRFA